MLDGNHLDLSATGVSSSRATSALKLEKDMKLEDGWFGQWRIGLYDDIALLLSMPEQSNYMWLKSYRKTWLMKNVAVHGVKAYQSGAIAKNHIQ